MYMGPASEASKQAVLYDLIIIFITIIFHE